MGVRQQCKLLSFLRIKALKVLKLFPNFKVDHMEWDIVDSRSDQRHALTCLFPYYKLGYMFFVDKSREK